MRGLRPVAFLALAVPFAGGAAESFEDQCRFAEAVAERMHLPDLAQRYLEALKAEGKVPSDQSARYDQTLVFLLDQQSRLEADPAKRAEAVTRTKALVKGPLDRILAPAPKAGSKPEASSEPTLADFKTVLAYVKIVQGASKGTADAGPRLKELHDTTKKVYAVLDASDFPDLEQKLDVMVECQIVDGTTVLLLKDTALPVQDRVQALEDGVKSFELAAYPFDDPEDPEAYVGFPTAYLGKAKCLRGVAELSQATDAARAKEALDEAKKILGTVLKRPAGPAVPPDQGVAARYEAARELLALLGGTGPEAKAVVQAFRKTTPGAMADLLESRYEMETARQLELKQNPAAAPSKEKAFNLARGVKERGGPLAQEADSLLSGWEGGVVKSRRNWKADADAALNEKRFDEAERFYRALARSASGNPRLLALAWSGIGHACRERKRFLEAFLAYERVSRLAQAELSPRAAGLAVACLKSGAGELPMPAYADHWKAALRLVTAFPDHPLASFAAYTLGWQLASERDFPNALQFLRMVTPKDEHYPQALYERARCTVFIVRSGSGGEVKEAEALLSQFEAVAAQAPPEKNLAPLAAQAGFLRIEILAASNPEQALALIEAYPRTYPGAPAERLAELRPLKASALAAKGDWAAAVPVWKEASEAVDAVMKAAREAGKRKRWPLEGHAKAILRLAEGKPDAGAAELLATIRNQMALNQPFKFQEAADRFRENFEKKRFSDAIVAGEQIQEAGVLGNADNWKWEAWFSDALAECYVETQQWGKALPLLDRLLEGVVIRCRYNQPGADGFLPPLQAEHRGLWRKHALASTRYAQGMPAGDDRKDRAARAAAGWTRLLDGMSRENPDFWKILPEVVAAEALSGKAGAVYDRLHGLWITYPELGGGRDRIVEGLRELVQAEPSFGEKGAKLLEEITGTGKE